MITLRSLFSVELIFIPVEDVETRFVLVKWFGHLMTAGQLTLWDLTLKFLVAWKLSWHHWDICFNFFSEGAKVMFSVSINKIINAICFTGWWTDFLRLITKPKSFSKKINVSLAMRISHVLSISVISSKRIIIRMLTRLQRAIGTLNNFVKILGTALVKNTGKEVGK